MLPLTLTLAILGVATLLAGCGSGSRPPSAVTTGLVAVPSTMAPGETVLLVPTFPTGTARLEPGVGPVESGRAYRVGPFAASQTFVLEIDTGAATETVVLEVPLRYRERVTSLVPSPVVRTDHGAAVLADGRVLLVGGSSNGPLLWAGAESFALPAGFAAVGDLSTGRSRPVVVALPDGGALAFGGPTNSSSFDVATRIEQWDPSTLAWSVRGNLLSNRSGHTGTLLDGERVLVVGGIATGGSIGDRDAEIIDVGRGSRSPLGEAACRRVWHTATSLLGSASPVVGGGVLLVGGRDVVADTLVAATEVFDPVDERFVFGPLLLHPRENHVAVRLADGSVLVAGGLDDDGAVAACERFIPAEGRFVAAGDLRVPRWRCRAVRLADGRVLLAGGIDGDGAPTDRIEVWSPATGVWQEWAARLPSPRVGHTLHLLPDARVVLLGGDDGSGFPLPTAFLID
ncbi:MAG: galactose oxidase [Planctomycetes bacterium]|nr:galactose oxidase [Planctomycetota bacterium]